MLHSTFILSLLTGAVYGALTDSSLEKHVGALSLSSSFNPIKDSYWTGYPHHRRTPFAVSPDGKSAYLAYLDASETGVHVQQVDPSTFAAVGTPTTVSGGKEAGGLVAHNDGFALLTNEALASGTANAPADSTPVPVLYRYTSGKQTFKTFLGGPGVHEDFGLAATPDINGDLAYSEAAGIYGAYFVVTAYTGDAAGHFGDSIQYVNDNGTLETITGASSSWGCSHNTGIAFEAADSVPFASICAEDQGAIWLNTKTQTMNGVKISNENVTNGASNEPMGGMSGSYSGLARFVDSDSYIFTWVSRGAKDLTVNDWLGAPYTHAINRTNNRNVAIAQFSDKNTLVGAEASSTIGAADGDSQVNWITTGTADCSNAHVAAFDKTNALVTWEEIAQPECDFIAMGCKGAYTGSYFQLVNNGAKVGEPVKATDVYVAGDMVTMADGRICWPYVDMTWTLDGPVENPASVTKISFACMSLGGSAATSSVASASSVAQSTVQPTSAVQEVVTSAAPAVSTPVSSVAVSSPATSAAPVQASETALPSFEIVSPGATIVPPTSAVLSSSIVVPTPSPSSTVVPFSSKTPTPSSAPSVPSEAPSVPSDVPVPTGSFPSSFPSGVFPSGAFPSGGFPSAFPTGGFPFDAFPSGVASPSGRRHHHGHHHGHHGHFPSGFGSYPSGFGAPRPTGAPLRRALPTGHGFPHPSGFGGPRPSGFPHQSGFGGPRPSGFPHQSGFGGPRPSAAAFEGAWPTGASFAGGARPTGYGGPHPSGFGGPHPSGFGGPRPSGFPHPSDFGGPRPTGTPLKRALPTGASFEGAQPTGHGRPHPSGFGAPHPSGFGGPRPSGAAFGGAWPTGASFGGPRPTGTGFGRPHPSGFGGPRPSGETKFGFETKARPTPTPQ